VTRDQLELVLRREGLTQPQTTAALQAADAYATTQAVTAIAKASPLVSHWQPPLPAPEGPACQPAGPRRKNRGPFTLTVMRELVTCPACQQTPAWKGKP
jgi:hypothetical protein